MHTQGWTAPKNTVRARPRPKSSSTQNTDNPFTNTSTGIALPKPGTVTSQSTADVPNPFADKLVEIQQKEDQDSENKDKINDESNEKEGVFCILCFSLLAHRKKKYDKYDYILIMKFK